MKAMLLDTTLCIGCRSCQVACKQWNGLETEATKNLPAQKDEVPAFEDTGYQNPRGLTDKTWTLMTFNEFEDANGKFEWVFNKKQCMHCGIDAGEDRNTWPSCVISCPVQALEKTEEGAVIWHDDRCIGCRYCMLACPFQVPKFEWFSTWPKIRKCTMCYDRLSQGQSGYNEPACSKVCPTNAVATGERDEMLAEARRRIQNNPDKYQNHIYGENELGGTCVLQISSVPLAMLGLPENLPNESLANTTSMAMKGLPYIITALSLGMIGVYTARRNKIESETNRK